MVKRLIANTLGWLGYEIRRKRPAQQGIGFNPSYLSRICNPRTVIDVGVGHGTFPLYEAYPQARFILVEPLKEYEPSIRKIAKKYDCDIYFKAAGERECEIEMYVDTSDLQKSSVEKRTSLTQTGNPLETKIVEVTALDKIYMDYDSLESPVLLKIDTEGHELSALKGAKSLLQVVDVVITEVSIAKRFEGSYEFEDIISFMNECGFYVFSFMTMYHKNNELRQRFTDVVFKRREQVTQAEVRAQI